jgi:hypothetical protein
MAGHCNLPSVSSQVLNEGGLAGPNSGFPVFPNRFVRVACCSPICNSARDARWSSRTVQHPWGGFSGMCLPFPVLFGANCLIRTNSRRRRLVAGRLVSRTELIVCFPRMHMHRKKKTRTLLPKRGRLITNSEFVSCLLAQRITGILAGMSGLLPPSFNSIHSPICNRQLIKNDSPFRKAKTQMARPPSNAAAVHLKNCRPFSKTQVRCTQHIDDHLLRCTNKIKHLASG